LGTILLGVFASTTVNANGSTGLIGGTGVFFMKETITAVIAAAYGFVFTYLILWLINKVTPVRISEKEELEGIDSAIMGERAYDEGCL